MLHILSWLSELCYVTVFQAGAAQTLGRQNTFNMYTQCRFTCSYVQCQFEKDEC